MEAVGAILGWMSSIALFVVIVLMALYLGGFFAHGMLNIVLAGWDR